MQNHHGDWVWYELMTPNADASVSFYGGVLGWTVNSPKDKDFDYREIAASDGVFIGGLLQLTPEMKAGGAQPAWVGYVAVDDVDASVLAIETAGGRTCMPARDMPGVGRMAMMFDPQGALFYVIKDATGFESSAFAKHTPMDGHCAWNELATSDPDDAKAFYSRVFGWEKDGEMDMGPMAKYEFIKNDSVFGAIMPRMPDMPLSAWTFYFRVPDIDAGQEAIKAGGGTILQEPIEIPGGDYSLVAFDPQGAAFGLVGARH